MIDYVETNLTDIENVMNKTRERALLAAQPGAISGGDDIALKQKTEGDE